MTQALGWAVVASGARVFVRSVSDTRRASIINWLVTEKQVGVYAYHTDDDIERLWGHYGQYVDVRQVVITDDPLMVSPSDQNTPTVHRGT